MLEKRRRVGAKRRVGDAAPSRNKIRRCIGSEKRRVALQVSTPRRHGSAADTNLGRTVGHECRAEAILHRNATGGGGLLDWKWMGAMKIFKVAP